MSEVVIYCCECGAQMVPANFCEAVDAKVEKRVPQLQARVTEQHETIERLRGAAKAALDHLEDFDGIKFVVLEDMLRKALGMPEAPEMEHLRQAIAEPPPPYEEDWPAFWASLSPREAWAALKAAPRVAGPWTVSPDSNLNHEARYTVGGTPVVSKNDLVDSYHVDSDDGTRKCATRDDCDARLRELGWLLVEDPEVPR